MKFSELSLAAHEALHSDVEHLVLPTTSWHIRTVPSIGVRCVALYTRGYRFYFQVQTAWPKVDSDFAILARHGHQVTWCAMKKDGEEGNAQTSVVIDGEFIQNPSEIREAVS